MPQDTVDDRLATLIRTPLTLPLIQPVSMTAWQTSMWRRRTGVLLTWFLEQFRMMVCAGFKRANKMACIPLSATCNASTMCGEYRAMKG